MAFVPIGPSNEPAQTSKGFLHVRNQKFSYEEIYAYIKFVLMNSSLEENDSRLGFVEEMRTVQVVDGEDGEKWLAFPKPEKS